MTRRELICVAVVGASTAATVEVARQAVTAPRAPAAASLETPGCVRVEGIAGDGLDDRGVLQAAIVEATAGPGCLELEPGRYDVSRRPEPGAAAIPSLRANGPIRIAGSGATLAMLGSGVRPGETVPGDWVLLEVTGPDITVSGLAFDGAARTATGEQTHLLQVRGPASNVMVERSTFNLPGARGTGGDCVRLFGEVDRRVLGVTLRDLSAPACVRSAIGLQRGVHDVMIERVQTAVAHGQAIDFEPTGGPMFGCTPIISSVMIRNSVFRRGEDRGITIAVAGDGCAVTEDVTISDSVIEDGGIDIVDVGRVTLERLRVENARGFDAAPTLYAHGRGAELVVRDSTFVRAPHERPHPVVQVSGVPGKAPAFALFSGVTFEQSTPRAAIRAENLGSLVVRSSSFVYRGAAAGDWSVSGSAGAVTLADVQVAGAWRGVASMPATLIRTEIAP